MSIDWSNGPAGATHFLPARTDMQCDIFILMDGIKVKKVGYPSSDHWAHTYTAENQPSIDLGRAISKHDALKAVEAPAWVGIGIPPDGTVCELRSASKFTEGTRLEEFPAGTRMLVGGRANFGGYDVAVVCVEGRHFCGTIIPEMLRPARTPEQIAAEERHAAIKAMAEIAYDATGFATNLTEMGALYDAGFRKFEIVDKDDGEGEV